MISSLDKNTLKYLSVRLGGNKIKKTKQNSKIHINLNRLKDTSFEYLIYNNYELYQASQALHAPFVNVDRFWEFLFLKKSFLGGALDVMKGLRWLIIRSGPKTISIHSNLTKNNIVLTFFS